MALPMIAAGIAARAVARNLQQEQQVELSALEQSR